MLFSQKQSYFKEKVKKYKAEHENCNITLDGFITLKSGKCLGRANTVRKKIGVLFNMTPMQNLNSNLKKTGKARVM
jgi:hypothetical protein